MSNRNRTLIEAILSPLFARERRIRAARRAAILATIAPVTRTAPRLTPVRGDGRPVASGWHAGQARISAVYAARKRGELWA